jgi:hypothetical protein
MDFRDFIPNTLLLAAQIKKAKNDQILLTEIEKNHIDDIAKRNSKSILFAGYPKSGNTWLRFLIYHYYHLKNGGNEEVLTYEELNSLQSDSIIEGISPLVKGYPPIVRTHQIYFNEFEPIFSKIIYVHRNPLDCLVSGYHFFVINRNHITKNSPSNSIDNYVKYNYIRWLRNFNSYLNCNQDVLFISFEKLKKDPMKELSDVLLFLGEEINHHYLQKSVELSDFTSIRKMTIDSGQTYGSGPKWIKGIFTRKGEIGSFRSELKESTIEYIMNELSKSKFNSLVHFD